MKRSIIINGVSTPVEVGTFPATSAVARVLGAKPLEVDGLAKPTAARVMSLARAPLTSNLIFCFSVWVLVSTTLTVASSSLVPHSSLPSGDITKRRGRLPTLMFLVTFFVARSITWTTLATSEVT